MHISVSSRPVTKGILSGNRMDAGASVSGGLSGAERFVSTTKPDTVIDKKPKAPVVLKFPDDAVSAGNFWTRLIINSWIPVKRPEMEPKQNHGLDRWLLANVWLPMPLTLSTAYNQTYTETEDMMIDRGTGVGTGNLVAGLMTAVQATAWQATQEGGKILNAAVTINNSAKMNLGSIMNQQMGLVYDGPSLRSHTLSWRMTPKDRKEQERINQIVLALKGFASPAIKGKFGGDVTFSTSKDAYGEVAESAKDLPTTSGSTEAPISDSLRNIGRLAIPPTVSVEFWFDDRINEHLFQIKDSFIQSVDVNYTPTGTWNAYEDGAPIETQLTIGLKENAIVASHMVKAKGGY